MLLGLLKNIDRYVLDPPKLESFEGSYTGAATFLESPSNLGVNE